jgi:LPXTG-site transpeptidase (sortase) family protein
VTAGLVLAVTAGGWLTGAHPAHSGQRGASGSGSTVTSPAPTRHAPTAPARTEGPAHAITPAVHGSAAPGIPLTLTITTPDGRRILTAPIDALTATQTPTGSWAPVNPPTRTHAVWVTQTAQPAAPSVGTTAIYGHACIGYTCVFDTAVTTPTGATITLRTTRAVLTYRVDTITQYPKTGTRALTSRPNTPNQLILVTCAYHPDHTTTNNLVITATLATAHNA